MREYSTKATAEPVPAASRGVGSLPRRSVSAEGCFGFSFSRLIFDPAAPKFNTPGDHHALLGGFPAPRRYIGWQTFFDAGDGQVKNNKKIGISISSPMFDLPLPTIAPHTQTSPVVLPQRNLLRQPTWGLPSGQAVAAAMGVTPLTSSDLADIASVYGPFGTSTPLWYYVLAESKVATGGLTLGPTGGRIVAETLIGLLRADPSSYLSVIPHFRPFLGTDFILGSNPDASIAGNRAYTRAHFLHYAGVLDVGVIPLTAPRCPERGDGGGSGLGRISLRVFLALWLSGFGTRESVGEGDREDVERGLPTRRDPDHCFGGSGRSPD